MDNRYCGCSLDFGVVLFLWIEAIFFGFLLFYTSTEIVAYGNFFRTSCSLTFATLMMIRLTAIYGVHYRKPSFLIPQMASQIVAIIFITLVIFFFVTGFSFAHEIFDFIMSKAGLLYEEVGAMVISLLKRIVVIPLLVILGVECCFVKLVHNYYLSLIPKETVKEAFPSVFTASVGKVPIQPIIITDYYIPRFSIETMV